MGLFGNLSGSLDGLVGQFSSEAVPALISAALAKTNLGGLQGLVNQFQQNGMGEQIKSWLGNGSNMQITPDQIRAALGSDQVKQIAAHFGVPVDQALKLLSEHLPAAVDQASPDGTLHIKDLCRNVSNRKPRALRPGVSRWGWVPARFKIRTPPYGDDDL